MKSGVVHGNFYGLRKDRYSIAAVCAAALPDYFLDDDEDQFRPPA
jgi:hypothetical protein